MRPARMLIGIALLLGFAWPAAGETILYQAPVRTEGAEVRCKPGAEPAVYVTQKLRQGAIVQVVDKTADGWLKIVPPQGSYSWINAQDLHPPDGTQPTWTVTIADGSLAPVLVGSPYKQGKPDVVGSQLPRGTQVVAVGLVEPPSEKFDGYWLPILPPPGEYRYIRDKDVGPPTAGSTTGAVTAAHSGSAGPGTTGVPASALRPARTMATFTSAAQRPRPTSIRCCSRPNNWNAPAIASALPGSTTSWATNTPIASTTWPSSTTIGRPGFAAAPKGSRAARQRGRCPLRPGPAV